MKHEEWRETVLQERNRRIFAEELDGFVPGRVFDAHVHVFDPGVVPAGESFDCAGHPLASYTLDDLAADLPAVYPGRETGALCFGLPDPRYDFQRNNQYLGDHCDRRRFFALRLADPDEADREAVRRDLASGRFAGIKPYPDYVRTKPLAEVEVDDMLPAWLMEIVNDLGLLVTLHLPRPGRLADPLNRAQVIRLCRRYPRAKIVLAHIGRAYYLRAVVGNLDELKELPNLWYDLAMLNHREVIEYLFRTVPAEKVLYGTDIPLALAPGKSVEINHQYSYVTPVPWKLAICDATHRVRFTSFLYEELRAIRDAAAGAKLSTAAVEAVFHGNVVRLLGGAC
jgi:glutamate-1-semialdehyde 2,1-aminomutase